MQQIFREIGKKGQGDAKMQQISEENEEMEE
jgi:hypothetical protein